MEWHAIKKEEVLHKLNSTENGLSEKEASLRLERYGRNAIEEIYKISPVKIFFKQFKSFLIYVLLFATVFSLAIKHFLDAGVIFAIILFYAFLGFIQQYKAEKSIIKLRKLLKPEARVFRDDRLMKIPSEELVPGDIIIFREGDKVTADCRLLRIENIEVNESILTGESMPVEKFPEELPENTILAERKSVLYSGTSVVKGSGKAVVVETGMSTEFGKIAKQLQEITLPETPMQKKLDKFAKQISIIVFLFAFLAFILGVINGIEIKEMLLTSIVLAVSAIPEGLPAIITISLAFAVGVMSKKNVIIRRLPAAETLGSVTVICSDKTGTMTEEEMTVREIFCNNNFYKKHNSLLMLRNKKIEVKHEKELLQLIKTSILCNNARFEKKENKYVILGDPTESVLVLSALDLGINKKLLTEEEPRIKELPFTSERKMMSIARKGERRPFLYSKGASELILSKCTNELLEGESKKLNPQRKKELKKVAESLESKGYRVLAFAYKLIKEKEANEENLIFLGFIAMLDPPRKEIREAIEQCKKAGIKIKMITGDSLLTARAVAEEIGISGKTITGQELDSMTDEQLEKEIDKINIFARVEPKQKLRIVQILSAKGEEVAITGDGINDVLALKRADIGISMGERGSDVAREVSDMILIDDNFASIVNAVEEGRIVYDNIKKATKFLLAVNFSELFLIIFTILAGLPLPLLPLQILWMNLVTDSVPALALTKEKGDEVMKSKPRKEKTVLNGILRFVLIAGVVTFLAEISVFLIGINHDLNIDKIRTMVLTSDVLFELFFVYTCRSDKSLKKIGIFSNKYLNYAVIASIMLHLIVLYTPLAMLFQLRPLGITDWLIILPFSLSGVIIFEAWKLLKKK